MGQGVGMYCTALLVVRTNSSTLRNVIKDEEEEGGREEGREETVGERRDF